MFANKQFCKNSKVSILATTSLTQHNSYNFFDGFPNGTITFLAALAMVCHFGIIIECKNIYFLIA